MGSNSCHVFVSKTLERKVTAINRNPNYVEPITKMLPITSFERSQSLKKSNTLRHQVKTKLCAGNFCNFTMKNHDPNLVKAKIDYEQLISKISLSFQGDSSSNSAKFKLEMGADHVEKERERLKDRNIVNDISYKYIMIGLGVISSISNNLKSGQVVEIDVADVLRIPSPSRGLEYMQTSTGVPNPLTHPSRIYDTVKVCEKCYDVYNAIRIARTRKVDPPIQIKKTSSRPQSSKSYSQLSISRRDSPLRKVFQAPAISLTTPVLSKDDKILNKALNFDELKHASTSSKRQFSLLYSLVTENIKKDTSELEEDGVMFQEVAQKFFPGDYNNTWSVKTQEEKNIDSWKHYIKSLKTRPIIRKKFN